MIALITGWSIEATPSDLADRTKTQQTAIPAVLALVIGVAALAGRRRNWALAVSGLAAIAAVVAVLFIVLLPGG